jgi:glycosyltransferase involved in cell wall biosynthesis
MNESVSVVIPTHNRPAMLREAIESALAQTYTPMEIIVVDNGPRAEAAPVTAQFSDRGVILIRSLEIGPSASRNAGIARARGRYVAFLDDDDLWHQDKLSVQMEFLHRHTDIAMASCRVVSYGDKITARRKPWVFGDLYAELFMESFIATPSVIVRRDVFDSVGLFDVRYHRAEDYDLWLRIADAFRVAHLKAPLVWIRRSPIRLSDDKIDLRKSAMTVLRERYNPDKVGPRQFDRRMSDLLVYMGRELGKKGDRAGARRNFLEAIKLTPFRPRPIRYFICSVFS